MSVEERKKRLERGAQGEALASRAYEARGARILARNVRYRCGELDLVVEERSPDGISTALVFVEVRARDPERNFAGAIESLSSTKLQRLRRAAALFLSSYGGSATRVRFDLASWELEELQIHENFWWY